jgi:hypothetical protein
VHLMLSCAGQSPIPREIFHTCSPVPPVPCSDVKLYVKRKEKTKIN